MTENDNSSLAMMNADTTRIIVSYSIKCILVYSVLFDKVCIHPTFCCTFFIWRNQRVIFVTNATFSLSDCDIEGRGCGEEGQWCSQFGEDTLTSQRDRCDICYLLFSSIWERHHGRHLNTFHKCPHVGGSLWFVTQQCRYPPGLLGIASIIQIPRCRWSNLKIWINQLHEYNDDWKHQ